MKRVYQINRITNEVMREFDNVIEFKEDYVLFSQYGNLGKVYAGDDEYFSEEYIKEEVSEIEEDK